MTSDAAAADLGTWRVVMPRIRELAVMPAYAGMTMVVGSASGVVL